MACEPFRSGSAAALTYSARSRGTKIDQSYIRHLLRRLAKKAGVERRVHANSLRHRFVVDLIKEGADLLTVSDLLGHSSAATMQTYLSRIGASDAVEFAKQRDWDTGVTRFLATPKQWTILEFGEQVPR